MAFKIYSVNRDTKTDRHTRSDRHEQNITVPCRRWQLTYWCLMARSERKLLAVVWWCARKVNSFRIQEWTFRKYFHDWKYPTIRTSAKYASRVSNRRSNLQFAHTYTHSRTRTCWSSDRGKSKMAQLCTSGCESDCRFWIRNHDLLLVFNSNHSSISLRTAVTARLHGVSHRFVKQALVTLNLIPAGWPSFAVCNPVVVSLCLSVLLSVIIDKKPVVTIRRQ